MDQRKVDEIDKKILGDYLLPVIISIITTLITLKIFS